MKCISPKRIKKYDKWKLGDGNGDVNMYSAYRLFFFLFFIVLFHIISIL